MFTRHLFVAALITSGALVTGCKATATSAPPVVSKSLQKSTTPDAALASLMAGNARFVSGRSYQRDFPADVAVSAKGQYPTAVVLSCIDSRTSPEIIFDQGVGEIFAPRIAGNFANTDIIGSMEFATAVVGSKLILVVGHTECGAIMGAADKVRLGNLTSVIEAIEPAAADVMNVSGDRNSKNRQFVNDLTVANVRRTVAQIRSRSEIISKLESEGKVKIVGAMYDIGSGKVTLVDR